MSTPDIEDRLARLAPVDPPDPAGFAAARARVDDAVGSGTRAADASTAEASPTGPADGRPEVTNQLAERFPDHHGARFSPDVVVPLTPRTRRRRALLVAASAVAVVGVLALVPGRAALERAEVAANQEALDSCRTDDDGRLLDVVTSQRIDDELLALLVDPTEPTVAFCAHTLGSDQTGYSVAWTNDQAWPAVGPDPTFVGVGISRVDGGSDRKVAAFAFWGHVGDDVVAATLTTSTGRQVEAEVTDGYWAAMFLSEQAEGEIMGASLTWELADGTTRTATLEDLSPDK
jgi:hypothetical protein